MEEDLKKAVSGMGQDTARALHKYLNRRKVYSETEVKETQRTLAFMTPVGQAQLARALGHLEILDPLLEEIKSQYVKKGDDA